MQFLSLNSRFQVKYGGHHGQVAHFEVRFGRAPTVCTRVWRFKVGISIYAGDSANKSCQFKQDIVDNSYYLVGDSSF